MPVYEASTRSTLVGASAGSVLFGFRAGSQRARIREIHLFSITAPTTSGAVGLARSTADGVGTLTSVAPISHDPNDAAGSSAVVWTNYATTLPTTGGVGTTLRRFDSPASFGNGVIWTFDAMDPLIVGISATTAHLVLMNLQGTAPGTYDFGFVWEE